MKRIAILIVIIIFSIFTMGCFNNNNGSKLGGEKELNLDISTDKDSYTNNSDSIGITIILKNIDSDPVTIEERFDLGSNIAVYIISPLNNTLKVHSESSTHRIVKITLDPNKEKKFEFNLLNEYIVYENYSNYYWDEKGDYSIYAEYKSLSGDIIVTDKIYFNYN